ncbi:MAG: hypothetical protein Q8R28_05025, partial [Dehalococcoidia bacterium]|nr:hypothetical protein [Dehalococcoidia bacterium]
MIARTWPVMQEAASEARKETPGAVYLRPEPGYNGIEMEYKSTAARRSAYLDIMRRRIHPGRGSSLALLRSRESYPMPDLNALFSGLRFVVVGGTATSHYMPKRMTRDVDILVTAADAPAAERALVRAGATSEGPLNIDNPLQIKGTSWKLSDGSYLDVLWSARPWVKKALASPNRDSAGL